jgi:segregation and condensation protein A
VDLARLSLPALLDQLAAALAQAAPLVEKADWLVMAAWLLQLRSNLLLPAGAPARAAAADEADRLRLRLAAQRDMQACAAWLDRRPYLGHDVFPRGQPALPDIGADTWSGAAWAVDVVAFLWACLDLFDDAGDAADRADIDRPPPPKLHSVVAAMARILERLAGTQTAQPLDRLLPALSEAVEQDAPAALRRRSAWTSTFAASLELARQGVVTLAQDGAFAPIQVSRPA